MSRITIVLEIADEDADPNDSTGLTNEAYEFAMEKLIELGEIVDIRGGGE